MKHRAWMALALGLLLAPASASGEPAPTRAWGKDVVPAGPAGFEVCTTLCQTGLPGSTGGELGHTFGVALTPADKVLVVDNQNGRIVRYDAAGHYEAEFGSGFTDPGGIAVGPANGEVYVADSGNNRVQRYSAAGTFLGTLGTSGPGQLLVPAGLTTGPDGKVYVADTNHHRIVRFSAGGTFEAAWGSLGAGAGQLQDPKDVAVDENGRLAVAEPYNRRVDQFTTGGAFVRAWGRGVRPGPGTGFEVCDAASGCETGATSDAAGGLGDTAWGIAADRAGSLYLADGSNHRVQQFTTAGRFVRAWGAGVATGAASFETCASTCQIGSGSDVAGGLLNPTDVTADCHRVFASDWGHYRVQEYSGAGTCPAAKPTPKPKPPVPPPPDDPALTPTLRLGKLHRLRDGSARLRVRVSAAGRLSAWDTRKRKHLLRRTTRKATRAGVVTLKLTPSHRGRRALRRRGALRVRAKVVFRPAAGGRKLSRSRTVRLRRARTPRHHARAASAP